MLQVYGFFTSDVIGQNFLFITASQVERNFEDNKLQTILKKSMKLKSPENSAVLQCCWLRHQPPSLAGNNYDLLSLGNHVCLFIFSDLRDGTNNISQFISVA